MSKRQLLRECRQALIWCSGSDDFAAGGQARVGFEKTIIPLIRKLRKYEKNYEEPIQEENPRDHGPCPTGEHDITWS